MSTLDVLAEISAREALFVLVDCERCRWLTVAAWADGLGVTVRCSRRCWGDGRADRPGRPLDFFSVRYIRNRPDSQQTPPRCLPQNGKEPR